MQTEEKKIKYPENLYLLEMITASGRSITHLAKKIGVSRGVLSDTVNGRYKGVNVVPKLLEELNANPLNQD